MAAVSRFFHALPKGRGGGARVGAAHPSGGPEAGRTCWGAAPARPPGEAGQSKNDRLPGKGTGKAEESLVVQRQHP